MRDNPEGGELNPAEFVHRRCKKNSPSVYPDREGPVPPRKSKVCGRRGSCKKNSVSK